MNKPKITQLLKLAVTILEKGFKYSNDKPCFESKRMILTQWIEYGKLSSVPDGPTLVLTKRFELIQHFCSKQYYTEACEIYLHIKTADRVQIVTRLNEEGKTDHLKKLAETLYSMPNKKHEGEAFTLAVTVGDHYAKEENLNLSNAELFYSMAFGWDDRSQELYGKYIDVLNKIEGRKPHCIQISKDRMVKSLEGLNLNPAVLGKLNFIMSKLERSTDISIEEAKRSNKEKIFIQKI